MVIGLVFTFLIGAALYGTSASASNTAAPASPAPACPTAGDHAFDGIRSVLDQAVAAGKVKRVDADTYACDPAKLAAQFTWSDPVPDPASPPAHEIAPSEVSPAAVADARRAGVHCRQSMAHTQDLNGIGFTVATFHTDLRWCYDGKRVSDWSGQCYLNVTNTGKAMGWMSNGCIRNDFVPYKLGRHETGGVDHIDQGQMVEIKTYPSIESSVIYIWGHYDGTCDHRTGASGKVYNYC